MKKEFLTIVTDGGGSFGYAHADTIDAAIQKAIDNIGCLSREIYKQHVWEYPAHYDYTINHFPVSVLFTDPSGEPIDKSQIRRIKLADV